MMTLIKVFAALVVLAVLGATAVLVDKLRSEAAVPRLEVSATAENEEVPVIDPGELAFERAREFLATGEFEEAREKLEFIVGVYPGSTAAGEARRILGEMNLDELLSTDEMEGKEMHLVERGDNFTSIARKHETTLDCIMHMNGLQRMDKLYPGDELVVLPLNFNIKIDVQRKRLSLFKNGRYLKSYPLLRANAKGNANGTLRSKIGQKIGLRNGKSISPVKYQSYRNSKKVLILAHQGLQIREMGEVDDENGSKGFFLSEADMEELALLLRVGNEVEVRY